MLEYELAHQRQEEWQREAEHDRLVAKLSPQPQRNVFALAQRELTRLRAQIVELGKTKPVRQRVSTWLSPQ